MPPTIPQGYLYGPPLNRAASEGPAAYEAVLGGLANLPQLIMQAQQLGPAGDAAYLARVAGGQKLGEAAAELSSGLTYGGGDALTQIFKGLPAGGVGGKGGRGALQMALDPQAIYAVQDEASRLDAVARAYQDTERRRMLGMSPLARAVTPQSGGDRGLLNVPAQRLGMDPRTLLRSKTIAELAQLVSRGDPAAKSMLISEGLDPNMTVEDLAGLAAKSRLYESKLASAVGRGQKERAAIDLSGRTKLMKARLEKFAEYDAPNIDEVAAELAKLPDEAARFALAELGRPTKFGHELALAKRRSVKTIIQKMIYEGLPQKRGGGLGGKSTAELGSMLKHLDVQIGLAEKVAAKEDKYTPGQAADLKNWREERVAVKEAWNRAYLGESTGPIGAKLPAGEEAAALWARGATYEQAFEMMTARHPDADIAGMLLSRGNRASWGNQRGGVFGENTGAVEAGVRAASEQSASPEEALELLLDNIPEGAQRDGAATTFESEEGRAWLNQIYEDTKKGPAQTPGAALGPEAAAPPTVAEELGPRTVRLNLSSVEDRGALTLPAMVHPTPLPTSTTRYITNNQAAFGGWDATPGLIGAAALREMASELKGHDIAGFERVLDLAGRIEPGTVGRQVRGGRWLPGTASQEEIDLTYQLIGDALDEAARRTHGRVGTVSSAEGREYPTGYKRKTVAYWIPDVGVRKQANIRGLGQGRQNYKDYTQFAVPSDLYEKIEKHRGKFTEGGGYSVVAPRQNVAPGLGDLQQTFQARGNAG